MRAKRLERRMRDPDSNIEEIVDLGFVGDPAAVDPHIIEVISKSDLIPVVAPIGVGPTARRSTSTPIRSPPRSPRR